MDLAGFEPAAFRMQSGRATTALKTHGCEILTWIHRPRIELGSLPWQGSILPLDQRCNDSEVIDVRSFGFFSVLVELNYCNNSGGKKENRRRKKERKGGKN